MNRRNEILIKTERLQKMLAEKDLGGVLLNAQHNFAWLTAGGNNGIDTSRENGAASLLVRSDGKRFVLTNNIEMPRILAEEISAEDFEPIEFAWTEEKSSADFLTEKASSLLKNGGALGADIFINSNTATVESAVANCRYALTDAEIERFRKLGKDAGETFGDLIETLRGGESEIEIARRMTNLLAAKNIRSVVSLAAADERLQKFRHPVPTEKCWKKVLMLVVCAKREGLIVSLSRIVCDGDIPGELRTRTDACARVNAKILAATKPNATGADLFTVATDAYAAENFAGEEKFHHQGGAAGYRTRDWVAHPKSSETVKNNQAFAWNPSITGTKCEETVIVRENEIESLTATPNFPNIAIEIEGREYLSPGILSL